MSTLTSILGTDLVSSGPSVLNANFASLNSGKPEAVGGTLTSPSLIGTPTAPTAVPGTSTGQIATTSFVAAATAGSEMKSYIVQNPFHGAYTSTNYAANSSISSKINLLVIPANITVNRVSLEVTTVNTAGSLRWGIYSSSGTQLASILYASITGTGIVTGPLSSVLLQEGTYYQALTPIEGDFQIRSTAASVTPALAGSVFGGMRYFGSVSVVGGALPTSFSPSVLAVDALNTINTRLDN